MALQDILDVIAADAQREVTAIQQAAEEACRARREDAETKAAEMRASILAEAQRLAEQEKTKQLHRVRLENLRQQVQVQQSAFLAAVQQAKAELGQARQRADYPKLLSGLTAEAVAYYQTSSTRLETDIIVVVDAADEDLIQTILQAQQIKPQAIETEGSLVPGVIVRSLDGLIVNDNTVESRLQRALPDLPALLADLLSAEPGMETGSTSEEL